MTQKSEEGKWHGRTGYTGFPTEFADELDVGYEVKESQVTLKVRELALREKT